MSSSSNDLLALGHAKDWPKFLKIVRHAKGWKQRELALHVGVTPGQVSRWEKGAVEPNDSARQKIRALGIEPLSETDGARFRSLLAVEDFENARKTPQNARLVTKETWARYGIEFPFSAPRDVAGPIKRWWKVILDARTLIEDVRLNGLDAVKKAQLVGIAEYSDVEDVLPLGHNAAAFYIMSLGACLFYAGLFLPAYNKTYTPRRLLRLRDTTHSLLLENCATYKFEAGLHADAHESIDEAISLNPDEPSIRFTKLVFLWNGKFSEAELQEAAEELKRVNPSFARERMTEPDGKLKGFAKTKLFESLFKDKN